MERKGFLAGVGLRMRPSQKGFTLFTALISFVLIFLVVLLVQTMISAERSTSDIIGDVEEEQEMQAIADLARADALQAFNLAMRSAIEAHITRDISPAEGVPDNQLLLSPEIFQEAGNDKAAILQKIKEKFTADFFGGAPNQACVSNCGTDSACISACKPSGEQFASIAAIYLSTILQRSDDVGQYDISIQSGTGSANIEAEVKPVISKAIEATPEFIEIVGCNGTLEGCPTGTFYVNLDLTKITDEEYEKLPQIVVKKRTSEGGVTGRVLKEPLLPRANLRLYVPLRIFKAIVYSEEFVWRDDGQGIFQNGKFKQTISKMRLGICDNGSGSNSYSCAARNNILLDVFLSGFSADRSENNSCAWASLDREINYTADIPDFSIFRSGNFRTSTSDKGESPKNDFREIATATLQNAVKKFGTTIDLEFQN